MKRYLAACFIVGASLVGADLLLAEETLDQKQAEWANEVRERQQPMVEELEGMLGKDTKLTLFAVDPGKNVNGNPDGTWLGKKMFRRHIIRSSAPIDSAGEREALIHALTDGMRETDGGGSRMFRTVLRHND
jgi:hypothetical protein